MPLSNPVQVDKHTRRRRLLVMVVLGKSFSNAMRLWSGRQTIRAVSPHQNPIQAQAPTLPR